QSGHCFLRAATKAPVRSRDSTLNSFEKWLVSERPMTLTRPRTYNDGVDIMELTNEFEVAVPVERAWVVLTDLERLAPCLPGAQLREVQGDEYRGTVKIK